MPNTDRPKALQLPGTLMERLSLRFRRLPYISCMCTPRLVGAGPFRHTNLYRRHRLLLPLRAYLARNRRGPGFARPPLTPGIPPGGGHVGPLPPLSWECRRKSPHP